MLLTTSMSAMAEDTVDEKVIFLSDPVYKKLGEEDFHPMDEMQALADKNNVRAQFILGDLYSKGKGGLPLDLEKARAYFEAAAIHGYSYALVRLAALEKRANKPVEAWKWYTIAIRNMPHDEKRMLIVKSRMELAEKYKLQEGHKQSVSQEIYNWDDKRNEILRLERLEAYEREKAAEKAKKLAKKKKLQAEENAKIAAKKKASKAKEEKTPSKDVEKEPEVKKTEDAKKAEEEKAEVKSEASPKESKADKEKPELKEEKKDQSKDIYPKEGKTAKDKSYKKAAENSLEKE